MYFEKVETITIDGKLYEIAMNSKVECYNCREHMNEIIMATEDDAFASNCAFDTYTSWKKDFIKFLKEWDKAYVKHMSKKGAYDDMAKIHEEAMRPLTDLITANLNFHRLELMIKEKKEVPAFRHSALEEEFCKFLTGICDILKEFGDLKEHFDIRQMLKILKIENWKATVPFEHYLTPLNAAVTKVRTTLLNMHKLGHLRLKYIIEQNEEL